MMERYWGRADRMLMKWDHRDFFYRATLFERAALATSVFILLSIILVLILRWHFRLRCRFSFLTCIASMWYDSWLSRKKSTRSLCNVFSAVLLQYQKQVTLQFTVRWVQCRMWRFSIRNTRLHRDTLVLFRFLAVRSPHSENNRSA